MNRWPSERTIGSRRFGKVRQGNHQRASLQFRSDLHPLLAAEVLRPKDQQYRPSIHFDICIVVEEIVLKPIHDLPAMSDIISIAQHFGRQHVLDCLVFVTDRELKPRFLNELNQVLRIPVHFAVVAKTFDSIPIDDHAIDSS